MKKVSLYTMAVLYIAAGAYHFIHPEFYQRIMPSWVPLPDIAILISGIFEILFALLLMFPSTRRLAAWLIIALLIAVFPANIQMMINYFRNDNPQLWITILRLPLQLVLVWWAYRFTKDGGKINL